MATSSVFHFTDLRSSFQLRRLDKHAIWRGLLSVKFVFASTVLVLISVTATAQNTKFVPTLVPGSEVSLSSLKAAEWVQGKLLLSTEASRLSDSLVETLLSGDEGVKQVAAEIKAAYDARDKTNKLINEIDSARRRQDVKKMANHSINQAHILMGGSTST